MDINEIPVDAYYHDEDNPGITGEMRNTLQDWERRESSYGWI